MGILEQYYRINEAIGIGIHLLPDDNADISACAIAVKDNRLDIATKVSHADSLAELAGKIPARSAIALNLTGRGILHKQLEQTTEINSANFSHVLPNAKFDDFYIQQFASGEQSFVSLVRRTEADKWIDQVREAGFKPLLLSLGPFPVSLVLPQLNIYEADFSFQGHVVARNDQKEWTGYRYRQEAAAGYPLKLESEPIDESLLLAYASAFQLVMANRIDPVKAGVDQLEQNLQAQLQSQKLKVQGLLILSVFFVLLLLNFVALTWLNSANTQIAEQVSRSAQSASDMEVIDSQVKNKEALLQTLGWDGGIHKSKLADQLGSLLPEGVSWKELAFNPVDPTASQLQKQLTFSNRRIRITGNSAKIVPVNEWIARVKAQHWVKNIQLDSYTYNTELNTGEFIVLVDY
jgi:hypothetical protein